MNGNFRPVSRRDFLIRSALFTAGACAGAALLPGPLARALDRLAESSPAPRIGFILDDVGASFERVKPFLDLEFPATFSVLPRLQHSAGIAEKIHRLGHEVMLHQPMEPHNSSLDPGPGALYLRQSSAEMESVMRENLGSFPHAVGFNNHMGSLFTESRGKMRQVLSFFLENELYFVDSCTSKHSVGLETARAMDMTAGRSYEFIDNTRDAAAVYGQLTRLKAHALKNGSAIGIGHPWPETAQGLRRFQRELKGSNFTMAYASQIACLTGPV